MAEEPDNPGLCCLDPCLSLAVAEELPPPPSCILNLLSLNPLRDPRRLASLFNHLQLQRDTKRIKHIERDVK